MSFRFKQFYIDDSACGMKVGTDGVLIGAWAINKNYCSDLLDPSKITHILDIGTGSGLVAIMLAQRFPNAQILGIDIDEDAVVQARQNALSSPFKCRLTFLHTSLQDYHPTLLFDAIVSNPPYFQNSLPNPDSKRKQARHSDTLSCEALIINSAMLLRRGGTLSIIIPTDNFPLSNWLAEHNGLQAKHICKVRTTAQKDPKRVMVNFIKTDEPIEPEQTQIVLQEGTNRSAQYNELTADFYL
ncbi:MAG: methyltransferase [Paludibacteraceae bacterium]|nr:methyltransferase [Paludibacteraceae bacterium]